MTKLTPPFSLIRLVAFKGGEVQEYHAYDAKGRYLLELTSEGAWELVERYNVKTRGFGLSNRG